VTQDPTALEDALWDPRLPKLVQKTTRRVVAEVPEGVFEGGGVSGHYLFASPDIAEAARTLRA
jgi:hypothetical protein